MLKINKNDCRATVGKSGGSLYALTDFLKIKPEQLGVMHFELPMNAKVELHNHANEEEMYYVLSGQGEVNVDNNIYNIMVGDLLYIPKNRQHSLQNIGNTTLTLLAIFSSPDALNKAER